MQCILIRVRKRTAKIALPVIAAIVTGLPYTNFTSRLLDRLIVFSEAENE